MPVTNYIWDEVNDTLLMETDEAGNATAAYTYEPGQYGPLISQTRNGHTFYHHYDGQGSTRALTDEPGNVTDRYTYTAFGKPVASSGTSTNPFGYKGALGYYANPYTDDVYVRARTFCSIAGRWRSEDPIFRLAAQVQHFERHNLNRFVYCGNDPVNWIDPSGWRKCTIKSFSVLTLPCGYYKDIQGGTFTSPFRVQLEFGEPCDCCEFRQYRSGFARIREQKRGVWGDWIPVTNVAEAEEDCRRTPDGVLHCYGHRDDPSTWFDMYHDGGCKYTSYDFPGATGLNDIFKKEPGTFLEIRIEMRFILNVIDTCCPSQGTVVATYIHDNYCAGKVTSFDKGIEWRGDNRSRDLKRANTICQPD